MIANRDIFILLLITVVTTSFALLTHEGNNQKPKQSIRLLIQNSQVRFDEIKNITLQKDGERYEFERNELEWWMVSPFELRMDSSSMSALVRSVQGSRVIGELVSETNPTILGLGDQANAIALTDGNGTISIRLGRKTLGGRAYAQVGDEEPVIIDQSLHRRAIDMDYRLWRDVRLFPDFCNRRCQNCA